MSANPQTKASSFLKEKELWLLIILGIALFSKPLFFGKTFFFGDLFYYFLPEKKLIGSLIRAGDFPLWNPYLYGGQPFLANLNNGVLYPSTLLYAVLSPLTAFNVDIVLHLILCAICSYLLARTLGFGPFSAFVCGLVFGFSGYTLSHGNLFNRLLAFPYLPLSLFLWHRTISRGSRRWLLFTAFAITIQFLAGAPETSILTVASLFFLSLIYRGKYSRKRSLAAALLVCFFVLGLSAIQTLPTAELFLQSPRGKFSSYIVFTDYSVNPKRIPELILPGFLGNATDRSHFLVMNMQDGGSLFVSSIYFGMLALFLAAYGSFQRRCNEILPASLRLVFFGVFVLSLLLSLGRYLPVFVFLFRIPFVSFFRYPVKFLTAGLVPISLLCAATVEHLFSNSNLAKPSKGFLFICWILFLTLVAIFFLFPAWIPFFFGYGNAVILNGVRQSFIHAMAIFLLACLSFQLFRIKAFKGQQWVLGGILTLDLLWAGAAVNPYIPRAVFLQNYPLVDLLKREIHEGRVYRPTTGTVTLNAPSPNISYGIQWDLATLNAYTNAFFEIPLIYNLSLESLETSRLRDLRLKVSSLPWEKRIPFLSVGDVNLVITPDQLDISALQPIGKIDTKSNMPFYIYKNPDFVSRIKFYSSGAIVRSASEALAALQHPVFDPQKYVVLEGATRPEKSCEEPNAEIERSIQRSDYRLYRVRNSCDGYLYVSEPYYRGWRVTTDGKPATIVPANEAFFAVPLAAGDHTVSIRYLPQSFLIGAAITTITLIAMAWMAVRRESNFV